MLNSISDTSVCAYIIYILLYYISIFCEHYFAGTWTTLLLELFSNNGSTSIMASMIMHCIISNQNPTAWRDTSIHCLSPTAWNVQPWSNLALVVLGVDIWRLEYPWWAGSRDKGRLKHEGHCTTYSKWLSILATSNHCLSHKSNRETLKARTVYIKKKNKNRKWKA